MDASDIWLTCAPESEKPTTVCGWARQRLIRSWSNGANVCQKSWRMSVSSASWIIASTACTPRSAATSATVGYGGNGDENTCIRSNSGGRASPPNASAYGPSSAIFTSRATTSASSSRRRCSSTGNVRSSRHSGRRSKGSCERNDEKAPMPRGWVTPHIRAPLAIVSSRNASAWSFIPVVATGTPVVSARSASMRSGSPSGTARSVTIWKIPASSSARTSTSAHTSSHDATRDATGLSSEVWWCTVREVVNPNAPARMARSSSARIAARSSSVACSSKARVAHDVGAQRRVADVGGVVDALREPVDRIEVSGEVGPGPLDPGGERRGRDVLGPLEVAHDELVGVVAGGREREAAMPHHDRGDAVPARVRAELVPEHLRVHVRVRVDEPRRDDVTFGVDVGRPPLLDAADPRDSPVDDADVGTERSQAGAVDHHAVANDGVEAHGSVNVPPVPTPHRRTERAQRSHPGRGMVAG